MLLHLDAKEQSTNLWQNAGQSCHNNIELSVVAPMQVDIHFLGNTLYM